jgi:hypothetical protein
LIAHAFLDLLPMPESMPSLLALTRNLAWLTINFDGVSSLEPTINAALDERIERLYHATMDTRVTGGDSRAGRHCSSLAEGGRRGVVSGRVRLGGAFCEWKVSSGRSLLPKLYFAFL